ncbi:glutamine amidotransferase [Herbiconiux moechotypicola]|uniref:Glutamine amidotransferase n=1 Tax=Herbiconiux moechotypicola TaxID=637393 RepID=A0ABN3DA07_9MICO|nr:glutamine amidotransferase [Herbiconiux moechotypicola]MCS5729016.1 glutamine amidotransferase [Herbiconiux moechotypicola]
MNSRVLVVGESWNTFAQHTKGLAAYTTSGYEEGADDLIRVLKEAGHQVDYMPNHIVVEHFPYDAAELSAKYDTIILSDVPADSFLLPNAVFVKGERRPNRLAVIGDFVRAGGGLLMVGGYMSFSGFEGRGRYSLTPLAEVLPVELLVHDDRVESPEGVVPTTTAADHAIFAGIEGEWPYFLGYNRFVAKAGAETIATVGTDPFIVTGSYGEGRVAAFASDCSPHWGSPEFMAWASYGPFWSQLVGWTAGE